jgi:hypothetical protein
MTNSFCIRRYYVIILQFSDKIQIIETKYEYTKKYGKRKVYYKMILFKDKKID